MHEICCGLETSRLAAAAAAARPISFWMSIIVLLSAIGAVPPHVSVPLPPPQPGEMASRDRHNAPLVALGAGAP